VSETDDKHDSLIMMMMKKRTGGREKSKHRERKRGGGKLDDGKHKIGCKHEIENKMLIEKKR
jgi:hypothetical protein